MYFIHCKFSSIKPHVMPGQDLEHKLEQRIRQPLEQLQSSGNLATREQRGNAEYLHAFEARVRVRERNRTLKYIQSTYQIDVLNNTGTNYKSDTMWFFYCVLSFATYYVLSILQ